LAEGDESNKLDQTPIVLPRRSPELTLMDVFPVERHLKKQVYAVPSNGIEDLEARFKAAVTTVDGNVLVCDRENVIRRTAVWLPVDGSHLENRNYDSLMI
jgi:hypothetical protein